MLCIHWRSIYCEGICPKATYACTCIYFLVMYHLFFQTSALSIQPLWIILSQACYLDWDDKVLSVYMVRVEFVVRPMIDWRECLTSSFSRSNVKRCSKLQKTLNSSILANGSPAHSRGPTWNQHTNWILRIGTNCVHHHLPYIPYIYI